MSFMIVTFGILANFRNILDVDVDVNEGMMVAGGARVRCLEGSDVSYLTWQNKDRQKRDMCFVHNDGGEAVSR